MTYPGDSLYPGSGLFPDIGNVALPGQFNMFPVFLAPGPFVAPGSIFKLRPGQSILNPLDFLCQSLTVQIKRHESNIDALHHSDDASIRELSYDATADNIGR